MQWLWSYLGRARTTKLKFGERGEGEAPGERGPPSGFPLRLFARNMFDGPGARLSTRPRGRKRTTTKSLTLEMYGSSRVKMPHNIG